MAVIQNPTDLDNPINYVATVAFFCCVSGVVLMLKFRGFKASLNLSSWRKKEEITPTISMTGAYRINRDEFYGNGRLYDPPKKLTPSMVKLPPSLEPDPTLRSKSTSDLTRQANLPPEIQHHRSTHDISSDPRGGPSRNPVPPVPPERKKRDAKNEEKEKKKLEKQKLAEQKARDKAAAQEQAKQDKLRREREKQAAQEQAKVKKNKKSAPAAPRLNNPLARGSAPAPPAPQPQPTTQPAPQTGTSYSTNTLDSSISKTSGPPPYSEIPEVKVDGGNSNPSNVSFGKPITGTLDSWDLISQHRQQMSRPVASAVPKGPRKNMVMDLQYKLGDVDDKENSEV